jgi:hypothetical protein
VDGLLFHCHPLSCVGNNLQWKREGVAGLTEAASRDYTRGSPKAHEGHLSRYRGNTATPTQAEHAKASLYHNLGAGGVDFPAIFKLLRDRRFKGWVVYDLDAPRPGDGTGSIQENLAANINYLRNVLT